MQELSKELSKIGFLRVSEIKCDHFQKRNINLRTLKCQVTEGLRDRKWMQYSPENGAIKEQLFVEFSSEEFCIEVNPLLSNRGFHFLCLYKRN